MNLHISPSVKEIIFTDAEQSYPNECCGFLFGNENHEQRNITLATIVNNANGTQKERKFEISERDYMKAERHADELNLTLLGIYHSHPNHPAVPSEYDLKSALPFFSYIIVSVEQGKGKNMLSWQLNEKNKFKEEIIIQ